MIRITWTTTERVQEPDGGDSQQISFNTLDLDIVEADSYDVSALVTSHAVEAGVAISDHVVPQQDHAQVTAIVSGRETSARFNAAQAGTVTLDDGTEVAGMIPTGESDRRTSAMQTLRDLCRRGVEVDVEGLRLPIEGWHIASVSSPRDLDTAGTLVADISLVEARYVELEEVDAPSPRVERGRRPANAGRSNSGAETPSSDDDQTRVRSAARAILDGVGGGS